MSTYLTILSPLLSISLLFSPSKSLGGFEFSSSLGRLQADELAEAERIFNDLQRLTGARKSAGSKGEVCSDRENQRPVSAEFQACDYQDFCSQLEKNKNSLAVYSNIKGESVPNYQLAVNIRSMQGCLGVVAPSLKNEFVATSKDGFLESSQERLRQKVDQMRSTRTALFRDIISLVNQSSEWRQQDQQGGVLSLWASMERRFVLDGHSLVDAPTYIDDFERAEGEKLPLGVREKLIRSLTLGKEALAKSQRLTAPPGMFPWTDSPFLDPALAMDFYPQLSKGQVVENKKQLQEGLAKAQRIFSQVQQTLLRVLQNFSGKMKKEILENLRKRIESIQLEPAPLCNEMSAFYQSATHSVTVCLETLVAPEASVFNILAHELSHALDPCILGLDLYEFKNPSEISLVSKDQIRSPKVQYMKVLRDRQSELMIRYSHNPEFFVGKNGKSASSSTLASGVSLEENPFNKNLKCLIQSDTVGARLSSRQKIAKLDGLSSADLCTDTQGGQLQEVFADWLSHKAIKERLKGLPPAEQNRWLFESQLNLLAVSCPHLKSDVESDVKVKMLKWCKGAGGLHLQSLTQSRSAIDHPVDGHPSVKNRINKIFLADPEIRAGLNCRTKPSLYRNCD